MALALFRKVHRGTGSTEIMSKAKLNLLVDSLLLVCIAAIAGIGFLLKYVLVPGAQRWEIYGRNVDLFVLGLDRHGWGTIHYGFGVAFLVLVTSHIILHWRAVVAIYRKIIPNRVASLITAIVLLALTITLLTFAFLVKPQVRDRGQGRGRGPSQHKYRISPEVPQLE
jgi:hypothetical protein